MKKTILRFLGRHVYGTFVPLPPNDLEGAETYLETLWRDAPTHVALMHTVIAVVVFFLPPFLLLRPKFINRLNEDERERFLVAMMKSAIYPIRLLAYGVKGHALVATFRKESTRRRYFPASLPDKVSL